MFSIKNMLTNNEKKIILISDAHYREEKYDELTQDKFKKPEDRQNDVSDATWLDHIFNRYRQGNERRFKLLLMEM